MTVTYMMLAFTTIYLTSTYLYYRYTVKKGTEFWYKPLFLFGNRYIIFIIALRKFNQHPIWRNRSIH